MKTLAQPLAETLRDGVVIPAHPLAVTAERKLDERHQRALTRYYCAAGVGGLAVGVHTTQFAIHDAKVGLLAPVLELASNTIDADANLLSARMLRELIRQAGFQASSTRNILFTPFAHPAFRWLDDRLGWIPLGAQYYGIGINSP